MKSLGKLHLVRCNLYLLRVCFFTVAYNHLKQVGTTTCVLQSQYQLHNHVLTAINEMHRMPHPGQGAAITHANIRISHYANSAKYGVDTEFFNPCQPHLTHGFKMPLLFISASQTGSISCITLITNS